MYWNSPSGHQVYCFERSELPIKTGFVSCRGRWPHGSGFSIYHEPGTWTLYYVLLCDRADNCRSYGADLDAITPAAEREYTVVNNRSPDITPPGGSNGVILTPSVSLAATNRYVRAG